MENCGVYTLMAILTTMLYTDNVKKIAQGEVVAFPQLPAGYTRTFRRSVFHLCMLFADLGGAASTTPKGKLDPFVQCPV